MDVNRYLETLVTCGVIDASETDPEYIRSKVYCMMECGVDINSWIKIFRKYDGFNFVFLITRLFSLHDYAVDNLEYAKHMELMLSIVKMYDKIVQNKVLVDRFISSIIGKIHKANTYDFNVIHNTIESARLVSVVKNTMMNITETDVGNGTSKVVISDNNLKLIDKNGTYSDELSAILINKGKVELLPVMTPVKKVNILKDRMIQKGYDMAFVSFMNVTLLVKIESAILNKK